MPDFSFCRRRCLAALAFWLSAGASLVHSHAAAEHLDWQPGSGFRSSPVNVSVSHKAGFTLLTPSQTGITFTNFLSEQRHLTNQILLNGSGVAAGDVDGDGWCDIYFCRMDGRNVLYRNLGNWKFEDVTESAGVACANISATGCAFVDLDGDGDLDLIVNSLGHGTHVFFNDGKGHFTEAPYVLNNNKGGMSLALGDLDGDGFLDLYVANYRTAGLMDIPNARATFKTVDGKLMVDTFNGRPVTDPGLQDRFVVGPRGSIDEQGEPDEVYRNAGGTNFSPIPFTGGSFLDEDERPLLKPFFDWGLSVMIRDVNNDGLPDIYVCNDFQTEDRFWINQGGGRFRLLPRLAKRKSSLYSMAADFADINRDGHDDFLVVDMMSREHKQRMRDLGDGTPPIYVIGQIENCPQYGLNTLFLNRGDDTYSEIAQLSGLQASEWSWSCIFLDVDLDGWEDVLISNGMERAARDLDVAERIKAMRAARKMSNAEIFEARRMFPRLATANLAFRNRHDLTFEEVGKQWGFDFAGISHGMALADLDNDGDLDVVVNNLNAAAGIYRNETSAPRIAVRLKGGAPNTKGIGARIKVFGGGLPMQSQEMICGGRYLSSDDAMRVFAAGATTNELRIEVTWRSGERSVVAHAIANRIYEIDESGAGASERRSVSSEKAEDDAPRSVPHAPRLFDDASDLIKHVHIDEPFDDFARQPLLPNRLSQLGPGVTWFDLDGDGWDDLIIGSGKSGQLAAYRNNGLGGFVRLTEPPLTQAVTRDQTTVLGWQTAPGQTVLLAGSANYEDGLTIGGSVRQFDLGKKVVEDALPGFESSTGPLALADIDGDGDLDLFVGGRVLPGKYPKAASSAIFRNSGGKFEADAENASQLAEIGLVSGAVFSDIDGDGDPDLILACEWGPIRLFLNTRGKLAEVTERWGLAAYAGWWNGVTTGDFDEDGRMDIVATNWGRNTKYENYRSRPLQVYYGDFDGNGSFEVIEAHYESSLQRNVPDRQLGALSKALPILRERFPSHRAFSTASVEEILGGHLKSAKVWNATWLESTVFLNRGDHFEARVLPVEAQMAPAFGVCVGDFDGDGHEDLVLAQNFFAVQPETARYDGGRGLWLKGDGQGGFQAVPGQTSGLSIYGEQRGGAVADYDRDGRLDLAIAQNGAATRLYRNVGAKPGLRVRLEGPPANPAGVGASLRLVFGQRSGPMREVHAGSGYWSQDSAVQVMGAPDGPAQILVRWPGGRQTVANAPPQAREIRINHDGTVRTSNP